MTRRTYYTLSILVSIFLHVLVLADLSIISRGKVSVELSTSKKSFKVNLSKEIRSKKPEKKKIIKISKEKMPYQRSIKSSSRKLEARSSVSVQNKYVPKYPYKSRLFGEEGNVLVKVLIGKDGRVLESKIFKSSGYERLDHAALEATTKSTFVMQGEGIQNINHTLEFEFNLKE